MISNVGRRQHPHPPRLPRKQREAGRRRLNPSPDEMVRGLAEMARMFEELSAYVCQAKRFKRVGRGSRAIREVYAEAQRLRRELETERKRNAGAHI